MWVHNSLDSEEIWHEEREREREEGVWTNQQWYPRSTRFLEAAVRVKKLVEWKLVSATEYKKTDGDSLLS